mgnify:FL=1|jgi:uncharacterized protein CbrC (UPF0167 family)
MTFRRWCQETWFDHCDEVERWTGKVPNYTATEYFAKQKWFLKRQYQSYEIKD